MCPSNRRSFPRFAFTLVEMLVVIAVIGILASLILPAVQAARESARLSACKNNIRQLALALLNFESRSRKLPASWDPAPGTRDGWSAQARLLPFLEEGNLFDAIDFDQSYNSFPEISSMRIPTFLCPSEVEDHVRLKNGIKTHYPINYGVNVGDWFVYDPAAREGGGGAFMPVRGLQMANIQDGASHTLAFAEVKSYNPYFRNAALDSTALLNPPSATGICALGGQFKDHTGHTEWVDGRVHQTGFTAALPPNAKSLCAIGGKTFDVDWTNQQEGKSDTVPTYAAVTARSYHISGVNVAALDASVHFVTDGIEPSVWRALATRKGKETSARLP